MLTGDQPWTNCYAGCNRLLVRQLLSEKQRYETDQEHIKRFGTSFIGSGLLSGCLDLIEALLDISKIEAGRGFDLLSQQAFR